MRWIALSLALFASVAAAKPDATWLPADTYFYLRIDDVARIEERFKKHPLHAMWVADELKPLRDRLLEDESEKKGGVAPMDILSKVRGSVILAFVPGADEDAAPETVFLVDFGDQADAAAELIARYDAADHEESGQRVDTEEFRGITIHHVHGGDPPDEHAWFREGSVYGGGDTVETVKRLLARREADDEDNLAQQPTFRAVREAIGPRGDAVAFLSDATWKDAMSPFVVGVANALGLDAVKALAARFTLEEAGIKAEALAYAPGAKRGLLKILSESRARLAPPTIVPDDTDLAVTLALDWAKAFDEGLKIADALEPGMEQQVRATLDAIKQERGLDFADFLGALDGEMTVAFLPVDLVPPPPGSPPALMALMLIQQALIVYRVGDDERMRGLLDRSAEHGFSTVGDEYLGVPLRAVGQGMGSQTLALPPGYLLQSPRSDLVKAALRRHGKDLAGVADGDRFERTVAHMPPRRFFLAYANPHAPKATSMFWAGFDDAVKGRPEGAPTSAFFKRYFDASAFAGSMDEHGLRIVCYWGMTVPD